MKFLVAFSSPKRAAKTLEVAAQHAQALLAEIILLRVIADPKEVGVVAELIATERPAEKAKAQLAKAVEDLQAIGIKASNELRIGPVARTILSTALELNVDLIFVGTTINHGFLVAPKNPVVSYLVDNSPISICLVKQDPEPRSAAIE